MRKNGTLTYILGDHLGSTSLVTDANGAVINQTKYKAWGETRYTSGTEQTKYQYTGQYSYVSDFGLHFYNARWYDSSLGRFAQADTMIPPQQGVQAWDRYAYTNNNPLKYTDPSGHCSDDPSDAGCWEVLNSIESQYPTVDIDPANWTEGELQVVSSSLGAIENSFGSESFQNTFQDVTISREDEPNFIVKLVANCWSGCDGVTSGSSITMYDSAFESGDSYATWAVLHENGHVYDNSDSGLPYSDDFAGEFWDNCISINGNCMLGGEPNGSLVSRYAENSPGEDFAETFAMTIWADNFDVFTAESGGMSTGPTNTSGRFYQPYNRNIPSDPRRINYMQDLIR